MASDGVDNRVERSAGPHGRGGEVVGRLVVAADLHGRALGREQFLDNLVFVGGQRFGDRLEARRELGIVGVVGQYRAR